MHFNVFSSDGHRVFQRVRPRVLTHREGEEQFSYGSCLVKRCSERHLSARVVTTAPHLCVSLVQRVQPDRSHHFVLLGSVRLRSDARWEETA